MATPDAPASAPTTSNISVRRGEPLVVIEHVDKHFGDLHVLKDIHTVVNRGEVVVVIGPSGSGKSTLCRAINRLETIDSGTIAIDGVKLPKRARALAKLRADVGMVFQSFNLFAHKTVLENVTLGPIKVGRCRSKDADAKAMALLDRVGVAQPGQEDARAALRRPAAARRDRAGARHGAEAHAVRRADERAGPRDDQRGPRRHGRPSQGRHDHDRRHP